MLDSDFHTLCVMTATIRTGKMGPTGKAWGDALEEAVNGYALLLRNRHAVGQLVAAQSAAVVGEPPEEPAETH